MQITSDRGSEVKGGGSGMIFGIDDPNSKSLFQGGFVRIVRGRGDVQI